ncbi:hypothetical protein HNQ75_003592 [Rhizobium flavum]|uniref:Uncharacterized protein n=1 Tax=Pseudorhizobium flavum TaxID=1335061 RepID=A0A7W9Z110_9HYPH|nr:hypothetical protein [Pseudorhizobium flavum]CAD6619629.1 hypothetical protein RFYW14_03859 [Pseudorhizobium flavum]
MGMIVTGIALAGAIAFGASLYFQNLQPAEPAWQVYSTEGARVGDPGHNLVGENWSGNPDSAANASEQAPS